MKVAVLGSKNFNPEKSADLVRAKVEELLQDPQVTIWTSDNDGVDRLVQELVTELGRPCLVEVANDTDCDEVHTHLIERCKKVIVFWDGAGAHTKNIATIALDNAKSMEVIIL